MVVLFFTISLTFCREISIIRVHRIFSRHRVDRSIRRPLLFLLCFSRSCTNDGSTWKLERTALPLFVPWLLTRNIPVVNCGGDSRAAWRPERRTKECRLERRGLTRINANWAAATGSSSFSIFVASNGTRPCVPSSCIHLRCFRCALVRETSVPCTERAD